MTGLALIKDEPMKEMTQPWSKIAERYADRASKGVSSVVPMPCLVRQIEQSKYAAGLFGWMSMHDLCVVQTRVEYPYDGPRLIIAPQPHGKVEFRYRDTCAEERQWHRTVDAENAFARLEGFLDQLHWFVKYKPAADSERER